MFSYLMWGLLFTFLFDIILRGGEHELNNAERIVLLVLWPIWLIWFVYHTIKQIRNNGK
jgi:hypothetical protein